MKYLLIIEEFGGWELYQELLQTLQNVAKRHRSLDTPGDKPASIAMVAIQYILSQEHVGGVIIGAHNSKYAGIAPHICGQLFSQGRSHRSGWSGLNRTTFRRSLFPRTQGLCVPQANPWKIGTYALLCRESPVYVKLKHYARSYAREAFIAEPRVLKCFER